MQSSNLPITGFKEDDKALLLHKGFLNGANGLGCMWRMTAPTRCISWLIPPTSRGLSLSARWGGTSHHPSGSGFMPLHSDSFTKKTCVGKRMLFVIQRRIIVTDRGHCKLDRLGILSKHRLDGVLECHLVAWQKGALCNQWQSNGPCPSGTHDLWSSNHVW